MNIIDLHVHSTKSDGSMTPTELVHYAIEKGLSAFALTDHDTTEGIDEALEVAKKHNEALANGEIQGLPLEVIPGIEFSTEYMGRDIHILGLYIDYNSPAFKAKIQEFEIPESLETRKCVLVWHPMVLIYLTKNYWMKIQDVLLQEAITQNIFCNMVIQLL